MFARARVVYPFAYTSKSRHKTIQVHSTWKKGGSKTPTSQNATQSKTLKIMTKKSTATSSIREVKKCFLGDFFPPVRGKKNNLNPFENINSERRLRALLFKQETSTGKHHPCVFAKTWPSRWEETSLSPWTNLVLSWRADKTMLGNWDCEQRLTSTSRSSAGCLGLWSSISSQMSTML